MRSCDALMESTGASKHSMGTGTKDDNIVHNKKVQNSNLKTQIYSLKLKALTFELQFCTLGFELYA